MSQTELDIITGAFGYSGRCIAQLLLERGHRVRTLTGHPNRPNPFGERVEVAPFNFDHPAALVESLRGATTFYNTYWVRFNRGETTFEQAVANTRVMLRAAREAGIKRLVHVSITNPSDDSPYPYFRGKAAVERSVIDSGLSYAILRPTVLFGQESILINNIACLLRNSPLFPIAGDGSYLIQPVHVGDLASLAVELAESAENKIVDAVGPEVFSFGELVRLIRDAVGSQARIAHLAPGLVLAGGRLVGAFLGDVVLTHEELGGLTDGLLVSNQPPTCSTRFSEWMKANAADIGTGYISEIEKHYR